MGTAVPDTGFPLFWTHQVVILKYLNSSIREQRQSSVDMQPLRLALLLPLFLAASLLAQEQHIVVCPDGRTGCYDGNTCCRLSDGTYGCCPVANAVCCSDGEHCCPSGYHCAATDCESKATGAKLPLLSKIPSFLLNNGH